MHDPAGCNTRVAAVARSIGSFLSELTPESRREASRRRGYGEERRGEVQTGSHGAVLAQKMVCSGVSTARHSCLHEGQQHIKRVIGMTRRKLDISGSRRGRQRCKVRKVDWIAINSNAP